MVYEYKVYCDDCCEFAYLDGFIGNLGFGKIYHEHDTFIAFMMEHGGHAVIILGQSADDLEREDYKEFQSSEQEQTRPYEDIAKEVGLHGSNQTARNVQ